MTMAVPSVKLTKGTHVVHLFYNVDRLRWAQLSHEQVMAAKRKVEAHLAANSAPSSPRITSYANMGGKADMAFMIMALELGQVGALHRELEACFPPGSLQRVYTFFSVTELPDYVSTEDDLKRRLVDHEKLEAGSEAFEKRMGELRQAQTEYEHYRLYPELPDWEVMAFYPMSKRRGEKANWYSLDFAARKQLMGGHARVGRKYAGRITQLITGSTGLDDWEWGVTLVAHQVDALKEIVYEMRFDEVTAKYGEFGPFYVNLRLSVVDLFDHLRL
ncbi:MAG TPA: chlorite dismutase family protein [Verrucomicrobiae bacterium]|nr:chlorite dismutase family protein [Verrucomicrobiae bacterium]